MYIYIYIYSGLEVVAPRLLVGGVLHVAGVGRGVLLEGLFIYSLRKVGAKRKSKELPAVALCGALIHMYHIISVVISDANTCYTHAILSSFTDI